MQVNDDYVDELFARKLGNMEATPPEDGWHRIESELNRRSRNTRKYWMAAASLALLLSVAASVVYLQTNEKTGHEATIPVTGENRSAAEEQPDVVAAGNAVQETGRPGSSTGKKAEPSPAAIAANINPFAPAGEKKIASASVQHAGDADFETPETASGASSAPETRSEYPVYPGSWGATILQPLKAARLEVLSKKMANKMTEPAVKNPPVVKPGVATYTEQVFANIPEPYVAPRKQDKWEVKGQFAPVFSYRAISNVPSGMNKSDFDNAESALLAYSGGVTVAYKVMSRLSIQTGVFYSQMGQSINNVVTINNMYASVSSNNLYTKNFVQTSSGSVTVASNMKSTNDGNYASFFNADAQSVEKAGYQLVSNASPSNRCLVERIDYLEIPVILRYKVVDRKLNFYLLGGMSTNILIDNNVFVDTGSDLIKEGSVLMARPVNYSSTFGIGLSYRITGNLLIDLEPSFKYFLQSYTTNSQIGSNPYAFGMYTGIVYRF